PARRRGAARRRAPEGGAGAVVHRRRAPPPDGRRGPQAAPERDRVTREAVVHFDTPPPPHGKLARRLPRGPCTEGPRVNREDGRPTNAPLTRRHLLQAGGLGCLGLSLASLLRAAEAKAPARVRSCILLFYYGGPSHLDTWDLKPGAPAEV